MKKILCIIISLSFLFSLSFAEELSSGEQLKAFGIIEGNENGDLNEEGYMTRAECYKTLIVLMGEENKVENTSLDNMPFKDVEKDLWYSKYIAYAYEQGLAKGVSNTHFKPNQPVDERVVSMVLLRYLGYNPTWNQAIKQGKYLGLTTTVKNNFNRGNVFDLFISSLNIVSKKTNKKGIDSYKPKPEAVAEADDNKEPALECLAVLANNNIEVMFYFEEPIKKVESSEAFIFSHGLEAKDVIIDADNPKKVWVFLDKEKGTLKDQEYKVSLDHLQIISVNGKKLKGNTELALKGKKKDYDSVHLFAAYYTSNQGIVLVFDDAISEPKQDMSLYELHLEDEIINPIRVLRLSHDSLVMEFDEIISGVRPTIKLSGVRDYSEQLDYKAVESMVYFRINIPTAPKRLKRIGRLVNDYSKIKNIKLFDEVAIKELSIIDKGTIRVTLTRNIFENELDVGILEGDTLGENNRIDIKKVNQISSYEYDLILEDELTNGLIYNVSIYFSEVSQSVFGKKYLSEEFKANIE